MHFEQQISFIGMSVGTTAEIGPERLIYYILKTDIFLAKAIAFCAFCFRCSWTEISKSYPRHCLIILPSI